jgi:arylformamidase
MALIDISQKVTPGSSVFPGDTPFTLRKVAALEDGASCDVGTIQTTLHIGTHADAPSHFVQGADGIGEVPLERYFGPVRVVERIGNGPLTVDEVSAWNLTKGMRYLVRTRETVDPDEWPAEFAHLDPAAAQALADAGVVLFGIDTPSVDHQDSKTLDAHKALLAGDVAILENLDLTGVRPMPYELMAFPLRIPGADASPVRAVLRTLM